MIKAYIYSIFNSDKNSNKMSLFIEKVIMLLIIVNVVAVVIEPSVINKELLSLFRVIEIASVIIFTVEYFLRLWVAEYSYPDTKPYKARIRYFFSSMAIIDLLAIIPFYVPFIIPIDLRALRLLRLLRLMRIFKVNRYSKAMQTVIKVIERKKDQLLSSVFVAGLLLVIASVLMYNVENAAQPEAFASVFHSMWWAVATLTTVGYGDIYPITVLGKVLASIIAVIGIGIVAIPTGIVASGFTELVQEQSADKTKNYCPYCGERLDE